MIEVLLGCCLFQLPLALAQQSPADPDQSKWQAIYQAGLVWVDPGHDVAHTAGYEFTESFNPETYERIAYVKIPGQSEPKAFYKYGRGITVALGHARQIVLINDQYTTKLMRVVVANLADRNTVDVSSQAMEKYQRDVKPDPRLVVNPEGYALSSNDRLALIRVDLTYLSVATKKEAEEVERLFQPRWYAVDTRTGQVLRTYSDDKPPNAWE
jgi:hypothetical protein